MTLLDLLSPMDLAEALAFGRPPTSSTSSSSATSPTTSPGQLEVGPASTPSGFLGAFITTAQYAAAGIAAAANGVVIDAIELTAPAIGGTQLVGLYRRPIFGGLDASPLAAFPTGGVPLQTATFAGVIAAAPPTPDGTMVLLPGAMQRRDGLGWWIPPTSGFFIVGGVGIDIAFGIYFHELPK